MKRYFMIMIAVFPVIWLLTAPVFSPVFSDEEPNPFREGTEKKTLTEQEKQSLLQYANTSKTTLERAKREAQGKLLQETLDIYVNAITSVVLKSFNEEKRRELLMRICLNQALQLTIGIPTPDGKKVEEEGVLTHAPLDLIAAVLENAIDLALSYYPKDKEAIEAGNLLKLPFFEYAAHRLSQAKSWLTGIHSWQLQLEFEKAILEQWKSSVLSDQNLERERVAPLILNVEEALVKVTLPQYTVSQKVRLLRGTIRQLLEDSAQIVSYLRITSSSTISASTLLGEFAQIRAGTFLMGSASSEASRDNNETRHEVTLSCNFEIMKTEVTQEMWFHVMGENPSTFKERKHCPDTYEERENDKGVIISLCPTHPVENVFWNDIQLFLHRLNRKNDNYTYRLPTEAEWEYAARAGTKSAYSFGDLSSALEDYGWFKKNSGDQTHPVASAPSKEMPNANPWGLYDMHGNVWEWVSDWYGEYPTGTVIDPGGPPSGSSLRVIRGGSWDHFVRYCRSANRCGNGPDYRNDGVGFRLARTRR